MKENSVEINTDFIRLDALLKYAGITGTGGEAKLLVLEGRVSVNGEACTQRGRKIYPGDKVVYEDTEITVGKGQ